MDRHMDIIAKKDRLQDIYDEYENRAHVFKVHAICRKGCAFCCIHFGHVDVITLEGLVIQDWIDNLDAAAKTNIQKKILKNMKMKRKQRITPCPFLTDDNMCLIYDIRPFSCRQLYSIRECSAKGPTVHRQAVELAKTTVERLQQLDITGYSGHISYILHLLNKQMFGKLYTSGGFDPSQIMSFGKKHGIVINRMATAHRLKSF